MISAREIESLAREIELIVPGGINPLSFGAEWARGLIRPIAALGTFGHSSRYPDRIGQWCECIEGAANADMVRALSRVRGEISEIDYDDGWATDKAGSALEAACLSLVPDSRWMAHAGGIVWKFATDCSAWNDVTRFSQNAWLRQLFDKCAFAEKPSL